MANAKIINYGQQISAGSTAIPDGLEDALDIESTESKDFLQISTATGDEDVRMVKSAHYAYGDNLNNTPKMTITPQSNQVLFDTGAGSGRDFSFRPEGAERFRVTEGHTKITGKGGSTGYDPGAGQTYEPTLFIENGTGNSADRCSLVMNSDTNQVNIDMMYQDNQKLRISAQDAVQTIVAEDTLVIQNEADTARLSVGDAAIQAHTQTKITGLGGTTGLAMPTGDDAPTLYLENSTGSSNNRTGLMMNTDGSVGCVIDMYVSDDRKMLIQAQSGSQSIVAEDTLIFKSDPSGTTRASISATEFTTENLSVSSTGPLATALSGTFTATQGSDEITAGSSTAFTTELHVGAAVKLVSSVSGGFETFTVSAIGSATAFTLDSNYLGTTRTVGSGTPGSGFRDSGELFAVKTGDSKTLLGMNETGALQLNSSTGDITKGNLVIGDATALDTCTDGKLNTIVGNAPNVYALTGGHSNSFFGYQAGENLSSGVRNTFLGLGAGYGTAGSVADNTYVGVNAGGQVTGSNNVAIGSGAFIASGGADKTAAVGKDALALCTGGKNTALGYEAGNTIVGGTENICIGHQSDAGTSNVKVIAIGNQVAGSTNQRAYIGDGSNQATLDFSGSGNSWSTTSDARIKENVQDGDLGLDFINSLRTVKYTGVNPADWPEEIRSHIYTDRERTRINDDGEEEAYTELANERPETNTKVIDGLIAQEVIAAAAAAGSTFSGIDDGENSGLLKLQYERMVIPLIKAVQELTARIATLEAGD